MQPVVERRLHLMTSASLRARTGLRCHACEPLSILTLIADCKRGPRILGPRREEGSSCCARIPTPGIAQEQKGSVNESTLTETPLSFSSSVDGKENKGCRFTGMRLGDVFKGKLSPKASRETLMAWVDNDQGREPPHNTLSLHLQHIKADFASVLKGKKEQNNGVKSGEGSMQE